MKQRSALVGVAGKVSTVIRKLSTRHVLDSNMLVLNRHHRQYSWHREDHDQNYIAQATRDIYSLW